MPHIDKVIISSDAALAAKYGAAAATIAAAITRLIAADAARGLTTQYIAVDGPAMTALGGTPVPPGSKSEPDYKDAVDAIYAALTPDYIAILGAPDVFPHQRLTNPVYSVDDDDDDNIPSDLPYACAAKHSLDAADFIAPDRVVSRIPDVVGISDPAYLEKVLDFAAQASAQPSASYSSFLGISADVWKVSTNLSLTSAFGAGTGMQVSPTAGAAWTPTQWAALSHFINCHGVTGDWRFYGEDAASTPEAHVADFVATGALPGTIVAAECCYGAELYDTANGIRKGIANTYLERGAFGFLGATNIAYGESDKTVYADLICAYFFQHVLAGESLGAATLKARQEYVRRNSPLDPLSLKTLAQFLLLGDPSIHAIASAERAVANDVSNKSAGAKSAFSVTRMQRAERRQRASTDAFMLTNSTIVSDGRGSEASPDVVQKHPDFVKHGERITVRTFKSRSPRGATDKSIPQADYATTLFHVALTARQAHAQTEVADGTKKKITRTVVQIATEVGGTITSLKTAYAR